MFSLHVDTSRVWRGSQSQVMHTVVGLRAQRQRAALVAHPEGELCRRMAEGTDLIPLASHGDIDVSAAWRLSRVIKQLRPDVMHAHDAPALAMAATAMSIAMPSPAPVLVASHRLDARLDHNSFAKWKHGQVDGFIASCEAVRQRLVADGIPKEKTTVVHGGVDVERIAHMRAANVHAAFYLPTHAPIVGSIGALVARKGQHYLIDAAAIVVRAVPDARFVIVGDGELRQPLEEHIRRKHLERHVFLAGFRADVLELLKGFDLYTLSSLHEGMCMSLVDAMAASKASIATNVGGVPEVMVDGETGFLVPPRDHEAMAEKIVMLLKDERLRSRLGRAGFERACDHFTVDRMVEGTIAIYERLLAARTVSRESVDL